MSKENQTIIINKRIEKKIKVYKIYIPIYKVNLKLLDKKNSEILDKEWKEDREYRMKATNLLSRSGDVFIRIIDYSKAGLVHELYHCVDFIFEYIGGMEKSFEDKEARSYLMQYLFEESLKFEKYIKK